jgi:hypothetical protein
LRKNRPTERVFPSPESISGSYCLLRGPQTVRFRAFRKVFLPWLSPAGHTPGHPAFHATSGTGLSRLPSLIRFEASTCRPTVALTFTPPQFELPQTAPLLLLRRRLRLDSAEPLLDPWAGMDRFGLALMPGGVLGHMGVAPIHRISRTKPLESRSSCRHQRPSGGHRPGLQPSPGLHPVRQCPQQM